MLNELNELNKLNEWKVGDREGWNVDKIGIARAACHTTFAILRRGAFHGCKK